MTTTIYEKRPVRVDQLKKQGFWAIAELASRYTNYRMLDAALGYKGAASKWFTGDGQYSPGFQAENRARAFLEAEKVSTSPMNPVLPWDDKEAEEFKRRLAADRKAEQPPAAPEPADNPVNTQALSVTAPQDESAPSLLLVGGSDAQLEKARKVLSMLGCDVVDV